MSTFMKKACAVLTMSVLSLSLMSMAQAGEVKKVMKDMKIAMQQAMDSKSMPEFSQKFLRLQNDAKLANAQAWKADPALYKEGMQKLQFQLDAVDAQIKANNLSAAKLALSNVNPIKKKYHNYLN